MHANVVLVEAPSLGFVGRQARRVMDLATLIVGFVSMIVFLALVAAIPGVQVLSLGYLLEAEARVARSGRLLGALPGLRTLARVGGAVIGVFLSLLPWLIVSDFRHDARLIDPTSRATRLLTIWFGITLSVGVLHASLALLRGGRLGAFFRPFRNVSWLVGRLRQGEGLGFSRLADLLRGLRLGHYFVLGLKGFAAALLWIALPTALLAVGPKAPPIALLGGFWLALMVIPLPLLQAHLAAEGRFRAGFELGAAWRHYRRAPIASFFALFLTLGLAVPLYVLKIELLPRDARVLAAAVFMVTILPTKLAAGWAYSRGHREGRAFLPLRFVAAILAIAAAGAYVLVLYLTRFVEWRGAAGLFEQHAFLVPVAFY